MKSLFFFFSLCARPAALGLLASQPAYYRSSIYIGLYIFLSSIAPRLFETFDYSRAEEKETPAGGGGGAQNIY
jgi:hypothetical protein